MFQTIPNRIRYSSHCNLCGKNPARLVDATIKASLLPCEHRTLCDGCLGSVIKGECQYLLSSEFDLIVGAYRYHVRPTGGAYL